MLYIYQSLGLIDYLKEEGKRFLVGKKKKVTEKKIFGQNTNGERCRTKTHMEMALNICNHSCMHALTQEDALLVG